MGKLQPQHWTKNIGKKKVALGAGGELGGQRLEKEACGAK